ncbi:MAG: hypothetical protein WBD13_12890 [Burkholderiaceae bacterium]
MKNLIIKLPFLALSALLTTTVLAAQKYETLGGDVYVSGTSPSVTADVPRDAFAAGFSVSVDATVSGDLHMAGFDINAKGRVAQDLYAAGSSINIDGTVDQDVTLAGFSVNLTKDAAVGANARIAAGNIRIDAPITGSLLASAGDIKLNSAISGDVKLTAGNIEFGPNARITGKLSYSAPEQFKIPANVIAPDRVTYTVLTGRSVFDEVSETIEKAVPSPWPAFAAVMGGFVVTLAFFLVVGGLFLAFAPERVASLRGLVQAHPGKSLLSGFLGLATLVGLLPVSAITIIGIPLVPAVILAIAVAWVLGYLLGSFSLAMRIALAFNLTVQSAGGKLLTLAVALTVLAVLNFIPFVGWLINLAIVLLGLGAMTVTLMRKLDWATSRPTNAAELPSGPDTAL